MKPMKTIIFGATGTLGRHLVENALHSGHQVTAFARRPEALAFDHPNLTRIAGDVLDPAAVAAAITGREAVLVALGAGRKGGVRTGGTHNIIAAMKQAGLARLVCLSTLGAGDSRALLNFFWKRIMFGLLLRPAYADHQAQEALVRESGLDWTIVRPGAFSDGPATGDYRHGFPVTAKNLALKISRADVADFMIGQLRDLAYLRQAPGLSY
jgi:uncharacterized protein YbjT (DUF2867 family)